MPRRKKSVPTEFQMERINEDNCEEKDIQPRSLVFKISKRTPRSKKNTQQSSSDSNEIKEIEQNVTTHSKQLVCDSSISIMKECQKDICDRVEIQRTNEARQSIVPSEENKAPELRRTSRRIILRVNKDFSDDSKITRFEKSRKGLKSDSSADSKITRFEKSRKGMKSESSAGLLKMNGSVKRGPGRPRKISPQRKKSNIAEQVMSFSDSKKSTPKLMKNSNVWTLVPKKIVDSEFFKSHIIKMHYPRQPGRKPKSYTPLQNQEVSSVVRPQLPSANRRKADLIMDLQNVSFERKPVLYQEQVLQKCSTRPTVIYFKPPKNNSDNSSVVQKEKIPSTQKNSLDLLNRQVFSSKQQWDRTYLRCKYSNAAKEELLDYIYGACYGDLQKAEEQLTDLFSGDQNLVEECDDYHKIVNPIFTMPVSIGKENDLDDEKDIQHDNFAFNQSILRSKKDVDTLCRQVIVDSMKLLYDEEAVLVHL